MCLLRIFTAVVQYCIMHAAILVLRNANSCLLAGILPIGFASDSVSAVADFFGNGKSEMRTKREFRFRD